MKLIVKVSTVLIEKYIALNEFVRREERKLDPGSWERERWRENILKKKGLIKTKAEINKIRSKCRRGKRNRMLVVLFTH